MVGEIISESWATSIGIRNQNIEIEYLQDTIYQAGIDIQIQTLTAFDRFSVRG